MRERPFLCSFAMALFLFGVVVPMSAQVPAGPPQTPGVAPSFTLADLERRALESNPTLAQARAEVEAARGRATQAGLLPNPTIGYSGEEISRGPIIRGGEHGAFIEQTIPLGGKLGLSRTIFEREASQAEALLDAQRQRILNDVRSLYYSALAADRRVEVRERLAALAGEAVDVSAQLYNTGAADRPDVMESEIEARQSELALSMARNDRTRVWRRLAAVIGDPVLTPQLLEGSIDAPLPELTRDAVLQQVLSNSPEIKSARAALARADAALTRARREPVPDLVVRGGPRYNRELLEADGRPVGWEASVDVGLVIPLFNRNQGGISEARAEASRAQQEIRRLELALHARVADAFDEYLTAIRMAESYRRDVLPRADESYRLYLARYRQMGAAYPQVLVAQRTLFQVSDQYVSAAESAWQAVVRLQGLLLSGGLDAAVRVGDSIPDTRSMMRDDTRNSVATTR